MQENPIIVFGLVSNSLKEKINNYFRNKNRFIWVDYQIDVELFVDVLNANNSYLKQGNNKFHYKDIHGIWFKKLPLTEVNSEENDYVNAEFYSCLITFLYQSRINCLCIPAIPSVLPCNLTKNGMRKWLFDSDIPADIGLNPKLINKIPIKEHFANYKVKDGVTALAQLQVSTDYETINHSDVIVYFLFNDIKFDIM